MFVAERMTKHPITVEPDATIADASRLMKKNHFHRMLVVDGGKLVGYFSDRDVMRVSPSPATTLSRFEIRELLNKLTVKEIMHKKVITVQETATIEEAALIMYNNKVGGLPVVSDIGAVVGIITATDILKTFVNFMGLESGRTRFTLEIENKVGTIADISKILADSGINIDSMISCRKPAGDNYDLVFRVETAANDIEMIKAKLESAGYKVIHVVSLGNKE